MEFPYILIDFEEEEGFTLLVASIDVPTTSMSMQYGIHRADFRAVFDVPAISANIHCYFTVGNLFKFYTQLIKCYNEVNGVAILEDYSSQRTMLSMYFNACTGHVAIDGKFATPGGMVNLIGFGFETDQTYIKPIINKLKRFFDELAKIQGFYDFQI